MNAASPAFHNGASGKASGFFTCEMALDILTRQEIPADEREYLSWLKLPFQTECDLRRAEHIDSAWFHTLSVQHDLFQHQQKK